MILKMTAIILTLSARGCFFLEFFDFLTVQARGLKKEINVNSVMEYFKEGAYFGFGMIQTIIYRRKALLLTIFN